MSNSKSKYYLELFGLGIGLILFLFLVLPQVNAAPAAQEPPPALLVDPGVQPDSPAQTDSTVSRSRWVHLNFDLLGGKGRSGDIGMLSSPALSLNLFDDTTFVAELDQVETIPTGGYAWIGHLQDQPLSQVIFVVIEGESSATITSPAGNYQIRPAGGDLHIVRQINGQALVEDEVDYITGALAAPNRQNLSPNQEADDGSIIDVMVLYTAEARNAAGGASVMQTLINLGIQQTNNSYANSRINFRLRLVHTYEVNYTETGSLGTALNRLKNPTDGFMDEIHGLRNQYRADLVSLWLERASGCGLAEMFMDDPASGFTTVVRTCAVDNFSFAHELGHNLGAHHDWYVKASTGDAPGGLSDNHGWPNYDEGWRTVMAYNNYCADRSPSKFCGRVAYFTNPEVIYQGRATGFFAGTDLSCRAGDLSRSPDCDANNARVLNTNALAVANYRQANNQTPTATSTSTSTSTATPTPTNMASSQPPTPTPTPTNTTSSQPPTSTLTPTSTASPTPTDTATATKTPLPPPTKTATPGNNPAPGTGAVYLPVIMRQPQPNPTPIPTNTPPGLDPLVAQVIELTNQQRLANGCQALRINDKLNLAAYGHSEDMALNDFFSHTGSDGSNPGNRIRAVGYAYRGWAENIAAAYSTAEAVMNAWMNSAGHRANILDCDLQEIGVGHYYLQNDTGQVNYNHYWTQVFGIPR
jgi:uncharacterized protein YkwD